MSVELVQWNGCIVTGVERGAWERAFDGEAIVHYWTVTVELEPDNYFTFPVYTAPPPQVGDRFDITVERSQP